MIGKTPFDVIILNGRSHFIHAGRLRDVGACAWYAFFPEATGKMTLVSIGAHDDVELGDEDSVGGRGYDSDEKDCVTKGDEEEEEEEEDI